MKKIIPKPKAPRTTCLIRSDTQARDLQGRTIEHQIRCSKDGQFWLVRPGSREKLTKRQALRTFLKLLWESDGSDYGGLTPLIRAV
jgi:hypothetical protein